MKRVLEGSHAVAEAVRLSRIDVVSAYPITPQTHIVERIADFCSDGSMDARLLRVESEHSAMAAVIGAAAAGSRSFTASSAQGLALMHEMLHWASGARLPIVMADVNRAMAPGWNIWTDQTDSLSQRDTGWIQLYCETGQEVFDTTLQAFKLAETVNLPVMVVLDAFLLSHTYEVVDVMEQDQADAFLPRFQPRFLLDPENPYTMNQMVSPDFYMEMRHSIQQGMEAVFTVFNELESEYAAITGYRYGMIESIACEDAEVIVVTSGTITSSFRQVLQDLRGQGEKVGLLKVKLFRPFPVKEICRVLQTANKVAVIDRNFCFGVGGIFAQEIRAAMYDLDKHPVLFSYIAGLGGRDVTAEALADIYLRTKTRDKPESGSIWIGLKEISHAATVGRS
jgi:pyruvate/2-oxoacid:ferredoxin oxidoreductase alpha subunit